MRRREIGGRPVEFIGRADLADAPVEHHDHLVRDGHRFGLIMGDEERRCSDALLQGTQFRAGSVAKSRVEIGEWFVEHKQRRLAD